MVSDRNNVFIKEATLTIADTAATKLFDLPEFARIVGVRVLSQVASVGATFTMGDAGTANKYVDAGDISAVGNSYLALLSSEAVSGGPKPVYGSIGGSPGAGGPFSIFVEYISPKSVRVI